jgi:hypothetical protein
MATSTCQECGGSGKDDDGIDCTACDGTGEIEFYDPAVDGPEDPNED